MIGIGKRVAGLIALAFVFVLAVTGYGGEARASSAHRLSGAELVRRWNGIAIHATERVNAAGRRTAGNR
jgi:hypothetical protein